MCALNNPRRIFFEKPKTFPKAISFTLTLLLTLGACRTADTPPAPTTSLKQLQVVTSETRHHVAFETGATLPERLARQQLDDFLSGRRSDERFALLVPDDITGQRRGASVTAILRSHGVPKSRIAVYHAALQDKEGQDRPEGRNRDGLVTVVARRYVVSAPACPDWSMPVGRNSDNRPTSNFGCATALNLGGMIADPADLAGGRMLSPDDGAGAVRSVQVWRAGQVPVAADPTKDE
ncbi:MAG: CpaD family pilus assembly lipoprotein [Rhodospirillales bacterium]